MQYKISNNKKRICNMVFTEWMHKVKRIRSFLILMKEPELEVSSFL